MSTTSYPASFRFEPPAAAASLSTRWLVIGAVAAIASVAGAFVSTQQFFRGYLIGYMLVLGFSLGSLALLMLGHLTGGNWWMIGRRVMEAAIGNLPLLTLLFCRSGWGGTACTSGWTRRMWRRITRWRQRALI